MADDADTEYTPDLGTNPATVQMYNSYFLGTSGALLKTRIADAATQVGLDPGLLAASLFAEFEPSSYTQQTGEVMGGTSVLTTTKSAKPTSSKKYRLPER